MWGGARLPSETRRSRPTPVEDAGAVRARMLEAIRDVAALVLVLLGAGTVAVGAGIQWGLGVGVFAGGLATVLVGVLLGMGER